MEKQPCVYIMASQRNGSLYVGMTGDLVRRVYEHKNKLIDGFSKRKECVLLVYYEALQTYPMAIARENSLKNYTRIWKVKLIERMNPEWVDLYPTLLG